MLQPEDGDSHPVGREEYLALCRRIDQDQLVHSKVLALAGEEVLQLFLSSRGEVRHTEEESQTVERKNISQLYFTIRNSVLLDTTQQTSYLQPLSNLALSVNLMEKLLALLQSDLQLRSLLTEGNGGDDFEFFADTVMTSAGRGEQFLSDTDRVPRMVIFYHTFRNKVVTEMVSKLNEMLTLLQNIIVNTENSTDKNYNMSIAQMKTLIGLPWSQQVTAIEVMEFEFDFLEKFQYFWFQSILESSSAVAQETEEEPETLKVSGRRARIHQCNFCEYNSKKMSNIKTHIKGKHRMLKLEPGESGFTTNVHPADQSFPKSDEDLSSSHTSVKTSKCVRVHQCNFCDYLSPKMSNIKTHLRGKHRNIEMEDIELGFTTHFNDNFGGKARRNERKLKKENSEDEWNANDIKLEPECDEYFDLYDDQREDDDNEDVPSLEDFLDININVGSRSKKKKSKRKNGYDSDDSFINDDSDDSDGYRRDDESFDWNLENMKEEEKEAGLPEFGKHKTVFEDDGRSFLYEIENHCHTCNANFSPSDNDKWREHMFKHSATNPFECPFVGCEKAFTEEEVLNNHVKSHTKEKPFVCNYEGCEKSFTRSWYLKVHQETCHQQGERSQDTKRRAKATSLTGNRVHQCRFCDYVTNKKSNIKQHIKGVHKNLLSDLESIEKGFTTLLKPEKSFNCPDCDYTTTSQSGLQKHAIVAHDKSDVPIKCDHCEFQSTSRRVMANHNKESHAAAKVFMCDQCDYSATREEYLRKHIKFHHEGFRYMCDKCDLTFKCPKSLEDHANSVHEGIFYQCDQCDYKCGHRSSFKQHYKAEHQKIRFPCDQCEYQAKDRSSLKQHIQHVHLKEYENVHCDLEGCTFKAEKNAIVYRHKMAVHQLASYDCTHCTFKATEKGEIFEHMKTKHDFILDWLGGYYFCDMCDFKSKKSGNLTKHKNCLHTDTSYACNYCGYTSSDPYTVKRHTKTQHGVLVDVKEMTPLPENQARSIQKRGYTWKKEKPHPMLREPVEKKPRWESKTESECPTLNPMVQETLVPQHFPFMPGLFLPTPHQPHY